MLVRSVPTSHTSNFRICGSESQPGLQLVERLKYTVDATRIIGYLFFHKIADDLCLTSWTDHCGGQWIKNAKGLMILIGKNNNLFS